MADLKISALTASATPLAGTEVLPIVQSGSTVKVSVANLTAGRAISASSVTASNLTSGRVATVGASGLIQDYSNFTYDGTTVSAPNVTATAQLSFKALTSGVGAAFMVPWQGDTGAGGSGALYTTTGFTFNPSNGNLGLPGNLVVASGKGIDFSATAGTGTSELLSDYEEGTWTPTLTPSTSGTITLGSPNECAYTKIGRVVTVNGLIDTASVSAPVGTTVSFDNLPFTSNATGTQRSAGTAVGFALSSGTVLATCTIVSSTTTFVVQINASLFQTGSQVYFQLSYVV